MEPIMWLVLILATAVCAYMAWNIGANDVANAMGTSVGSRALTLKQAVIIAAVFEFMGAFFAGDAVTDTVRKGILYFDTEADYFNAQIEKYKKVGEPELSTGSIERKMDERKRKIGARQNAYQKRIIDLGHHPAYVENPPPRFNGEGEEK